MANKRGIIFLLSILIFPVLLFSQEDPDFDPEPELPPAMDQAPAVPETNPDSTAFRIQGAEGALNFIQRLSWEKAVYASRYEIVVQVKRVNTFVEVMRYIVEENFVEISVPAGEYRYKISSFNVLGRLDREFPWVSFTVIQAQQPSVFSYLPENFYFDRLSLRMIRIEGVNLLMNSEIYLLRRNEDPAEEEAKIIPREIRRNDLGEFADLFFFEEDLVAGLYDIIVKNPGGLETAAGPFGISVAKPYDINVSGAYAPMVKLYGNTAYVIESAAIPLGFGARGSFVPFKWDIGFLGVEANLNWAYFSMDSEDPNGRPVSTRASMLSFHVGPLYQYWFKKNVLALNARAGLGISSLLNYHFEYADTGAASESLNSAFFSVAVGASVQYLFYNQIFAEVGIDFMHAAASDLPMGFLRFALTAGWQF
ncbi:hypothetical protein [Leadbettera azotonutricia]|uniref:Outer membrane protein beta-barrel domain-containing protein n=1 Tax=Leadbettera azotonutricia (strain ATCC BAA-888 / DSM 13862 / ZAS-9) TaxID=545695 RepID=F5Y745_LEAAZ|nr:hypothetical protein [Leadbettera azotonutricia]AEF81362.1 hypothetical protein TREAZ_1151 [Leadbettera azotonutricia ZAS-9]